MSTFTFGEILDGIKNEESEQKNEKLDNKDDINEEDSQDSYFLKPDEIEEYRKNDEIEQKGVSEVRMSNAMYNRIIVVELISVFFATFSMVLSVLIYESRSS